MLRVLVHPADIQDGDLAAWLLANARCDLPTRKRMWVDQGYNDWRIDTAKQHDALTREHVAE